ncbi:ABC transporter permease [Pelotalea chapellei]|uniref:Transport permease protein n=1 Tax=Pelotalea chapellei TaxID=44671 RepID=A0ABS5U3P9_9BACT|nr:ABC transporter permease [Pelotalea chapellei]MBT1070290.1 ABC transporter permease [Pelotalea chapellei]
MKLQGALAIWRRDMLVLRRSVLSEMVAVVAYPLTIYLAFGIGMKSYIGLVEGVPYSLFIAPGLITMTAVNAAYSESVWSLWFHRRVQFTIESYRVTPVSVSEIVVAKIFSGFTHGLVKALTVALVIFAITPFRFAPEHLLGYLAFLIPGSAFFSCAGVICGTIMDKPETIGKVEAVFIMPLIFMSGLFFPLSSYPEKVIPWIRALPTTALFEGARQALVKGSFSAMFVLQIAGMALITFVAAVWIFRLKMSD